ncbi:hypothetical protein [Blastococcus sp. TF02A-35]|uniref:hypothetical protein n=1 Tax=Blastococcus sp. TF02A-35 TaxID=2559612 RepID=UPI0010736C0D|nr:hypothetical protein [Blastococcus sp. TF02A_35]TFV47529.1 hypothetical protein E4P43_15030 [Blastococcus sp. TF02A_35]
MPRWVHPNAIDLPPEPPVVLARPHWVSRAVVVLLTGPLFVFAVVAPWATTEDRVGVSVVTGVLLA